MPSLNILRKMQCPVNQVVAVQLKSNVRMSGGVDRKNGAERWAGRLYLAAGYLAQYVAPAGLRPDH